MRDDKKHSVWTVTIEISGCPNNPFLASILQHPTETMVNIGPGEIDYLPLELVLIRGFGGDKERSMDVNVNVIQCHSMSFNVNIGQIENPAEVVNVDNGF